MQVLCVLLYSSLLSAQALIMPISKSDGSLDTSSLLSHISLLEQTLENKASLRDISKLEETVQSKASRSDISKLEQTLTKLESELQTARLEQKVTQSKLDTALDELKDLSNVKTELAVLQSQMQSGKSGSSGTSGGQPAQDLSGLRADMSIIKTDIFQLQSLHNGTAQSTIQGNSVYTRWGRTACPPKNNLLYKGYAAGSYWSNNGGSARLLCLPEQPIYSKHRYGVHDTEEAQIWGTEYILDFNDMPLRHLSRENMPCVVCESNRATSIMVPARNACYQGWTQEYSGFLMGGHKLHSPGDYICVDIDAEARTGGHVAENGKFMYPVQSKCGILDCPPYEDGQTVTCVVCSK